MKLLPDILDYHLKVLFVGYNPGLKSAETGHHYAGASNGFWKLLYESGITPYKFNPEEDRKLLELGYGSTNIVKRPTKSAAEIRMEEFREGAVEMRQRLQEYRPRMACYVGIGVYKAFSGLKEVCCGLQRQSMVEGVEDFVCSSTSGLNRMSFEDQLVCFKELKKHADQWLS